MVLPIRFSRMAGAARLCNPSTIEVCTSALMIISIHQHGLIIDFRISNNEASVMSPPNSYIEAGRKDRAPDLHDTRRFGSMLISVVESDLHESNFHLDYRE